MQNPQELLRGTRTEQGDSHCDSWSGTYTARQAKANKKVITMRVWNAVVVLDGMSFRRLVKQHHPSDACRRWLLKERKVSEVNRNYIIVRWDWSLNHSGQKITMSEEFMGFLHVKLDVDTSISKPGVTRQRLILFRAERQSRVETS